MSFYNSKRRSLIYFGRNNSSNNGLEDLFDTNIVNGGDSYGSTSSSSGSSGGGGGGVNPVPGTSSSPATATTAAAAPTFSLQQLARSRSFGGSVFTPNSSTYCNAGGGSGGGGLSRNNKGSFYHNYTSNSFVFHGPNSRTGTWSSSHSPGQGVLGQGYGNQSSSGGGGGVSRKLMNSLGTLTHSSSSNNSSTTAPPIPLGSTYCGTGFSSNGSGNSGGGLLGSNSTSMRLLPTTGSSGGGSGGGGGNVAKGPRPNKTRIAIESLIAGLQDCIKQIEEEMSQIRSSITDLTSIGENQSQGKLYELEKYSKSSDRHLKRIEYQLSIVEELGEQYSLQQKLREGVRTMAFAFSVSQGPEKETALANVKAGFRECTEMLCSLETQLEMLLGTFHMEMKGIQGFARLCPGDVFEITIKHGQQKWKTRGKVGKDGSQIWDLPLATFRAVLGEVMHIKAAEVKTLGKHILLGNKFCEISELFSSHAQLMTVNLNPSGSLKLNIIVTWNPLECGMDFDYRCSPNGSLRSHSQNLIGSPSRKRRLSPTEINFRHSMSSISPDHSISRNGEANGNKNTKTAVESASSTPSTNATVGATTPASTSTTTAVVNNKESNEDISDKNELEVSSSTSANPTSRHSALWERSLDSIEIIEKSNNLIGEISSGTSSFSSYRTPEQYESDEKLVSPNVSSSSDENSSSFRFCPAPSERRASSPHITLTNNSKEESPPTATTIRVECQKTNAVADEDKGHAKSSSKILIEQQEEDMSPYKHDPNIHRISIASNDSVASSCSATSTTSSMSSDPSGNFTFLKKRKSSLNNPSESPAGSGGRSQIEFETNIALEELDMAIIDGDNSTTNNITTIEESMEEFCSYDDDDHHRLHNGGDQDDEGHFDEHGGRGFHKSSSSGKINSSNIGVFTLRNSVLRLSSLLEDIQGQYSELEPLEMHLTTLEKMIQNPCFLSSSSSSLNIESALECFDFLDTEEQSATSPVSNNNNISICELPSPTNVPPVEDNSIVSTSPGVYIFGTSSRYHHRRHQSTDVMDPKMTARTTDSGISSLGHHSRSPSPTTSRNSSPMHTVTGSSQLDMVLSAHIQMCLQLIHNVGSFGPLKHREKQAITKLQQQGIIIGSIIGRTKSTDNYITNGLHELASLPQLQVLWERITDTGGPLYTSADHAIHGLESDIKAIIQVKYSQEFSEHPNLARKVSHLLVQQILETGIETTLDLGQLLTVFQFQNILRPHEHSFHKLIYDLTEEEILQLSLQDNVVSGIRSLPLAVPPKNVLFTIIRLLLHADSEIVVLVKNYFNAISIAADKKRQIIETSLEMLEFPEPTDRRAACLIFIELKSFWRIKSYVVEPLLYLIQTDRNEQVRNTAKETILQILGDSEGDRILQQVALSTHGFQGLGVN